jgi:type IV pilus assembly protein PilO
MATKSSSPNIDVADLFEQGSAQFRGLDFKQPGQWPLLPKLLAWLLATAAVVALAWVAVLATSSEELEGERAREPGLKEQYRNRLTQAVNLTELRKQKLQVQEYVTQLEKQLPGKADMDALLSDINQAGLGRGLQFELFRPGQVQVKDYYAELPIAIRVSGRYHDIGAFAADVANLSRIVTLQNLTISPLQTPGQGSGQPRDNNGMLAMDATAHTYRYLYSTEVAEQREARAKAGATGAKP